MTIHEKYHEIAERSLNHGGIDGEAYIVKVLSEMVMNQKNVDNVNKIVDKIPESHVDEHLDVMQDLFIRYMNDKTEENLTEFLTNCKKMLSEVYHSVGTAKERQMCKKMFDDISNIC